MSAQWVEGSKPLLALSMTYVSQGIHTVLGGPPCNDNQRHVHRKGGFRNRSVQEGWGERRVSWQEGYLEGKSLG